MATSDVRYPTGLRETTDGSFRQVYVNDMDEFGPVVGKEVLVRCEDPDCNGWFVRKRCPGQDDHFYFAHAPAGTVIKGETVQPSDRCSNNGWTGLERAVCAGAVHALGAQPFDVYNVYDGRSRVRYDGLEQDFYADLKLVDRRNGNIHYVEIITTHPPGFDKVQALFDYYEDPRVRVWRVDLRPIVETIREAMFSPEAEVGMAKMLAELLPGENFRQRIRNAEFITQIPTQYTERLKRRRQSIARARWVRETWEAEERQARMAKEAYERIVRRRREACKACSSEAEYRELSGRGYTDPELYDEPYRTLCREEHIEDPRINNAGFRETQKQKERGSWWKDTWLISQGRAHRIVWALTRRAAGYSLFIVNYDEVGLTREQAGRGWDMDLETALGRVEG